MVTTLLRSKILLLTLASIIAMVTAVACAAEEAAEPAQPQAAAAAADAAAPEAAGGGPGQRQAARAADTPLPAQAAADPEAPEAAEQTGTGGTSGSVQQRTAAMAGPDLHASQVVTSVGRTRSTMAPWRDGGGNRIFSTQVFGPPFIINQKGDVLPWIATGITSNESLNVWTMKLREDAVFQDGTPITAADLQGLLGARRQA